MVEEEGKGEGEGGGGGGGCVKTLLTKLRALILLTNTTKSNPPFSHKGGSHVLLELNLREQQTKKQLFLFSPPFLSKDSPQIALSTFQQPSLLSYFVLKQTRKRTTIKKKKSQHISCSATSNGCWWELSNAKCVQRKPIKNY